MEDWAEDMVAGAEKEMADTKAQIRAANRESRLAATIEAQHEAQQKVRDLERKQRQQRQRIFDVEDDIRDKRDKLIAALERRLNQRTSRETLFIICWKVE